MDALLTHSQWQALIATTAYSSAVIILSMVNIYHPSYQQENWHQSLLMIGVGLLGTLMNTYGAKRLPILEGIVLVVHIFGFFCIIIPLWVLSPKAPASEVFGTFDNFGGWSTIGTACFVGSITATGSFAGSDAAVHMSEETTDASKSVPRMIMFTIVLNGIMGFVFIITYVSLHHMSGLCPSLLTIFAVLLHYEPRSSGHVRVAVPFYRRESPPVTAAFIMLTRVAQVFLASTNSNAGTVCMMCIPLILSVCTSLNALAAASRQAWALSRDQALPFSSWFRRVSSSSLASDPMQC